MKTFKEFIHEDAVPVNATSGGGVAGIGIGPNGEPGVDKKNKKKVILKSMMRRPAKNVT